MPWPLTAGALLALLLQLPRQLTVAATLQAQPISAPEAQEPKQPGERARQPQAQAPKAQAPSVRPSGQQMAVATAITNPLLPFSHLLGAVEGSD